MTRSFARYPINSILTDSAQESLMKAVRSSEPVQGLTHSFYRYPARFSPQFARTAIEELTNADDLVLDPFMGGGTTIVEALALGRRAAGSDISALADFLTRVKTTRLSEVELARAVHWADEVVPSLTLHQQVERPVSWIEKGYQRNINGVRTWPIRKSLELALASVQRQRGSRLSDFLRCAIIATGQWALDCRSRIPTACEFRTQLSGTVHEMVEGISEFTRLALRNGSGGKPMLFHGSAADAFPSIQRGSNRPQLVLTSPPYPGVHVVYHRWQIHGRKETAAPFWLAGRRDGKGASYYALGERRQENLHDYFANLSRCFTAIRRASGPETLVVQLVAFSTPALQLPRYLAVMEACGFSELRLPVADGSDGRIWREVPNRRWYANQKRHLDSKNEVLLVHRTLR